MPNKLEKIASHGEGKLVKRIRHAGKTHGNFDLSLDDSALFKVKNTNLFFTSDHVHFPCLAHKIGLGTAYHSGWISVVKIISDLYAVGSTPLGILLALELEPNTMLKDFDLFFEGVSSCCKHYNTALLGGNIKESKTTSISGFGVGELKNNMLSRGEIKKGYRILLFDEGDCGAFWAGIATHIKNDQNLIQSEDYDFILEHTLRPKAKEKSSALLSNYADISFTMDCSDGTLAGLFELAKHGGHNILINLDKLQFNDSVLRASSSLNADHRLWALGWGSASLLCCCSTDTALRIKSACIEEGLSCIDFGEILSQADHPVVFNGEVNKTFNPESILQGEQFLPSSFHNQSLKKTINFMCNETIDSLL